MATIFVVEWDPGLRLLLRILLEIAGHDVIEAGRVPAHDRIRAAAPDLVVTDMMMGGTSSWELIERLRADPETVRIPILTMSTLPRDSLTTSRDPGADAFLTKPFDPDDLIETVEALIDEPRGPP